MAFKTRFQRCIRFSLGTLGFVSLPALGMFVSFLLEDWTWFARFGSLMVAASVVEFAWTYANDQEAILYQYLREYTPSGDLSENELKQSSHGATIERFKQSQVTYLRAVAGAVIGTLVWGFGDLVGLLFK